MSSSTSDRVKPTDQSPRGQFAARVLRNTQICAEHYRLVLALQGVFPPSTPGQFVQVECRGPAEGVAETTDTGYRVHEWTPGTPLQVQDPDYLRAVAYLRRPFSIAARRTGPDGRTELDLIYRVVGRGTRYLESLREGDGVSILGPLGNGFVVPQDLDLALLVGGGVGIPPMFYLAQRLAREGKKAIGFVGAQRRDLLPLTLPATAPAPSPAGDPVLNATEFAEVGFPTAISTDDGSLGMKGFVTAALRKRLEALKSGGPNALRGVVVYCCGPTPMMRATAAVAAEFAVRCQVSLEQPMACGMGTCQSCIIRWAPADAPASSETPWVYKLTCTDGPVFDAREIRW